MKHIRVIVDTSASLHKTDPSGYVKLSTELFFDLARKELNPNDTFRVAHFPDQGDPGWRKTSSPPDTIDDKYVYTPEHDDAGMAKFHERMRDLPYTSQFTYFSPGMQWALKDLEKAGSPKDDRVIVLITDGIPETFAKDEDSRRLRAMASTLREDNIRVFVLAFGDATADWFNGAFGFGRDSGAVGQAFAGADSGHLLNDMLEIFSRSFGFSKETLMPGTTKLDVARDVTLARAAVVALYRKPGRPDFQLVPPAGQSAGTSRTFAESAQHDPKFQTPWKEVSYAYEWLDLPAKGVYGLASNGSPPDEIAVLRPARVQTIIRSYQGNATDVVMADKEAPMEVLVSSTTGMSGDPGDVRVGFYLHYLKQDDEGRDAGRAYKRLDDPGRQTPEGRVFKIQPRFARNPTGWPAGTPYQGYIDVEVVQNDTPIDRMATRMHPVTVYPYLSVGVSPNPAVALNSSGGEQIHGGQAGCVPSIKFIDNTQTLTAEHYMLAVRLADPLPNGGGWKGVRFRFDGKDFAGSGSDWQATDAVTVGDLTRGKSSLCVIAGTPSAEVKQDLQIHFGLWRDGADVNERKLNVVDDMTMTVTIEPPGAREIWRPWLLLLLTVLLCALLWLLLRSSYQLAPDLGIAVAPRGGTPAMAGPGARRSPLSWLGFAQERPVNSLDGAHEIGHVKPLRDDLFIFRPARGYQNVTAGSRDNQERVNPEPDGSFRLASGVTYCVGMNENAQEFRIEYAQARPRL